MGGFSSHVYKIVYGKEAPSIQQDQLPLVKMHGDIDNPSSIVITKPDYDEYAENHRSLIMYLSSFLITHNILFVGFSMKDPNFDNIYTQMKTLFEGTHRKSYAVFKDISEHERARLKRMGIEVISIRTYNEIPLIFEEFISLCSDIKGKPELTLQQMESIQNTFREVVERQNKWLDSWGIFQSEKMLTRREIELEQIYVKPRLVKQEITKRKKRGKVTDESKEAMDEFKGKNSLEDDTRIRDKDEEEYIFEKQAELSIRDALSNVNNKHMVILGDPGSGKTCLLQYIALKASATLGELGIDKLLPVFVPLREYYRFGQKEMLKEFIFHYIDKQICSLPETILEYLLNKNLFFFLLDGLDEVVEESERIDISRQIERFMAQYPRTRMILTSRPAGYRPAALIGAVPHFTLADFNEDETKEFLVKWFMFLDKIEEEKFEKDKTMEKAHKLAGIIMETEKILRLVKNPLLLTILVLIQRFGGKLPERRVEFYDLAVRTFIGSWETWKNLQVDKKIPGQHIVLAILEKVGFNLHKGKQGDVVEVEELTRWLQEAMEEEVGHSSKEEIDDFIWMLQERMELLVEKGAGLFGFEHLTFQEYFAARYIAKERDGGLVKGLIKKDLHSSRWKEVFLLAAAMASPERADLILDSALEAESPFEKYTHANVMVAGLMLADLPRVELSKRKDVIERLISFTRPENIDLLRVDALETLTEIGRTSSIKDSSWALRLLRDEEGYVREQAVKFLSRYAREESSKRAPNLFESSPLHTKRDVYKLMKALLQT